MTLKGNEDNLFGASKQTRSSVVVQLKREESEEFLKVHPYRYVVPTLATTFAEVQASNVNPGTAAVSLSQFTSVICEGRLQSTRGLAEGVHFLHIIPKTLWKVHSAKPTKTNAKRFDMLHWSSSLG